MFKNIPIPVIRRLSRYLTYLSILSRKNVKWVYSDQIAAMYSLTSITVRRDISYLKKFSGIPKRGYNTKKLAKKIHRFFKNAIPTNIVVIGAGSLGFALVNHRELLQQSFKVCGIFDSNISTIGRKIGGFEVQGFDMLPHIVWAKKVDIGIIAAIEAEAQHTTDLLVIAGIRGILNFTSMRILAPKNVVVIDAPIFTNLMELSCLIQ